MTLKSVKINQFKSQKWIISFVLLFILYVFFRFWNLEDRTIFGWDQERDAFQIYNLVANKKLFLIGPRILSDTGFFLAPYYTYLLTPFYVLTRLNPYAIVIFLMTVNSIFFVVFAYVMIKLFGEKIAFFALFLYTINPLMIRFDTIAWNPVFIPLSTTIVYGIWYGVYRKKIVNPLILFLLGITNGLAFHFHVQGGFLLIQTIGFLLFFHTTIKQKFANIGLVFLGFVSTFLPIILFDIRHDFLNSKLILSMIHSNGEFNKNMFLFFPVLHNFISWQGIPLLRYEWLTFTLYTISAGIIIFYSQKQKGFIKYFNISYVVLMFTVLVGFMIYGKRPSEYYFNVLVVGGLIVFSQGFISLYKRIHRNWLLWVFVFLILLTVGINNLSLIKTDEVQGLGTKDNVVSYILDKVGSCELTLHKEILPGFDTGFSYLIQTKKTNVLSNCKKIVRIAYPPKKEDKIIGRYGISIINF